jgi:tRNA pseudouridine32 synthase/23S rRNA pseudouridine746 synthase
LSAQAPTDWATIRNKFVLFDDEAVLAVNKPCGVAVVSERGESSLITLARDAGDTILPAHRIDKATSGVVLLARGAEAHGSLARQFNRHSITKSYLAIVRNSDLPEHGRIELPLSAGRKSSVRIGAPRSSIIKSADGTRWSVDRADVFSHVKTYPSETRFVRLWQGEDIAVLGLRPTTGRRHQIRVHLAWIGHPILGDPLFGQPGDTQPARTYLHAWRIAYDAEWSGNDRTTIEAPPDENFWDPVRSAANAPVLVKMLADARVALDESGS